MAKKIKEKVYKRVSVGLTKSFYKQLQNFAWANDETMSSALLKLLLRKSICITLKGITP
jgi:hypothetical protein